MPNQLFDQKFYTKGREQHSELSGVAVTADNSNDLPNGPAKGIFCTGAGNIALNLDDDSTATLTIVANEVYLINFARVKATGTTATGIVALYPAGNL